MASPTISAFASATATSESLAHGKLALAFSGVILVWYCILWSICLLGLYVARTRYASTPSIPSASSSKPGVSILRPLKGLDPNLYENLRSSFEQDYPDFELIFSVADEDDPALRVVKELIDKYGKERTEEGRKRTVRVIIGDVPLGPNPKINNLIKPFELAFNDILYVLDSGIHLPSPHTLSRAIAAFLEDAPGKRRVGLVHHVPFAVLPGKGGEGVGSWLERAFLNTVHAKMYLAINKTEIDSCVMGKSNIYRRSDISVVTAGHALPTPTSTLSLPSFAPYLAEDNMVALSLMHQLKLRHSLPPNDVALNNLGSMSFSDYFWRRVRWIRVRKQMTMAATLAEPFTESLLMGLLASWALEVFVGGGWKTRALFLVAHYVAWASSDCGVMSALTPPLRLTDWGKFWLAWIGREVLALPVWTVAMLGNEVVWRGRRYVMLADGKAREVKEKKGGAGGENGWLSFVRGGRSSSTGVERGYEAVATTEGESN
ncbi:hypothetical protein BDY24DRAFT_344630 [Mrakia frigida]|uniref:uncharacterized protein n=1 Tax=Mrakia frigida TaxID=29902 RepID=UPI003FCBFC9D